MQKKKVWSPLAALLFFAAALPAFATDAPKSSPAGFQAVAASPAVKAKSKSASERNSAAKPKVERPVLGEAFITGSILFVHLDHPASISLFNARGEQLAHIENARSSESIPLAGVNAGFLYLTLHSGTAELTSKLVYTGK